MLLAFVMVLLPAACTAPQTGDAMPSPAASTTPTPTAPATPPSPDENLPAEALSTYREYLSALTGALAAGDPAAPQLADHATGPALETARQQLQANVDGGLIATGTIQPAATAAEVTVDGDRATVQDCLLNDLAQVRGDNPREVVQAASGNRQPLTATLTRGEAGWIVSEVSGPELRGPVLQGESCAPPALEQELLSRYEAYWDAYFRAGDPGGGQPANPEDPALSAAAVEPQLPTTRAFLTTLRDQGHVLQGRPTTAPTVLAVLDYDQLGVVTDCVVDVEGSGVFDAATGEAVDPMAAGTSTPVTAELRLTDAIWKTSSLEIVEGRTCAQFDG